jgi:hypothetical protein
MCFQDAQNQHKRKFFFPYGIEDWIVMILYHFILSCPQSLAINPKCTNPLTMNKLQCLHVTMLDCAYFVTSFSIVTNGHV